MVDNRIEHHLHLTSGGDFKPLPGNENLFYSCRLGMRLPYPLALDGNDWEISLKEFSIKGYGFSNVNTTETFTIRGVGGHPLGVASVPPGNYITVKSYIDKLKESLGKMKIKQLSVAVNKLNQMEWTIPPYYSVTPSSEARERLVINYKTEQQRQRGRFTKTCSQASVDINANLHRIFIRNPYIDTQISGISDGKILASILVTDSQINDPDSAPVTFYQGPFLPFFPPPMMEEVALEILDARGRRFFSIAQENYALISIKRRGSDY